MVRNKVVLKDVAKEAGRSMGTVSLALRDDPIIKKETREHVQKIARKIGYHPSALGRALATQRTFILGLTITDITNPFYGLIIESIEESASKQGYHVMLCNTGYEIEKEKNYIRVFMEGKVDGVVIDPVENNNDFRHYKELTKMGIPFVLLRKLKDINADYVMVDDETASYTVTKYIMSLGRKSISYIGNTKCGVTDHDRLLGYKRALEEAKMSVEPELIISTGYRISDGYDATKELLSKNKKVDAIVAFNDLLALGVIDALEEANIKIPEDIAVVGFDDIEFSKYAKVPLTTMSLPRRKLGEIAVQILMKKIKEKKEKKRSRTENVILDADLVVRDSCGGKR